MNSDGQTRTVEHDGFSVTSTDSEDAIKATLGMDVPATSAPAVVDTDDDLAEEPTAAKADAPAEPKVATEQPRDAEGKFTRKDWQKRVDKLTFQAREAERRAERAEAELAGRAPVAAAPAAEPAAAKPDTFPTWEAWTEKNDGKGYEDYLDERADFRAERKAHAILAARDERAKEDTAHQEVRATIDKLKRLGEAAHPDFEDVMVAMAEDKRVFAPHLAGIIAQQLDGDAPLGHELAYFLATHPDDLRRLNALPPLTAAMQVQKILDTFQPATRGSGPERPAVSQARRPTQPIGAGPSADPTDSDDEPFEKFYERENAKDRKAGRLR
jgi:hypothetical protein